MALVEQGRPEEGLARMEEASKIEPDNLSFRADLVRSRTQVANRMLAAANNDRAVGKLDAAQATYERILRIDPANSSAKAGLDALAMDRRHDVMLEEARTLLKKGELDNARTALKPVLLENPKNGQAVTLQRQIDEQIAKAQVAEPALMTKFKKPVSMQFRDASVKMVFEAISRASGINILLDKDVRPDLKTSIFVKDVSVDDAIDLILMQSQLEKKVISDNTLFIYPNTPLKAKEYQDLKIRSFHLTNADPKQMMALIKSMLKTKDIFVHEKTNSLVMRDTPEAIRLAEKMIADQDIADPEVMLEVEVLEISRSRLSEIGVKFPSQLTFTALGGLVPAAGGTGAAATTLTQLTVRNLKQINGAVIGVSPAPAITLNAMLQDGDTNILSSPRIRVRNREKAKIMIGERVPMITNSVTPVATGTPVVTGTVTYQDVGIKLDVEPEIHLDNQVSIKVGLEVSSLGIPVQNSSGSTVYRVGTRNTSTVLRLKDGETQILAGLISDDDRSTADKVPGLGQLPIAGRLFSSKNSNASKTEIILSITPRIVGSNHLQEAREVEYWSGTEATLRSSPLMAKPLSAVSPGGASAAATRPQPVNAPPAIAPVPVTTTPLPPAPVVPATDPVAPAPVAPAPVPVAPAPVAPAPVAPAPVAPAPVAPAPVAPGAVAPGTVVPSLVAPSAVAPAAAAPRQIAPGVVLPGAEAPTASALTGTRTVAANQSQSFSWQGSSQARVGDKFRLTLNTESLQNVKNLEFQIGFAPEALKAVDVLEGNLMKHMILPSRLAKVIDQPGGKIQVDLSGGGAGKSGSVVTLVFEATAPVQQSPITISAISSSGVNNEALATSQPVPYYISVVQ
ncbi:MAG TPA: secretin N-terminal domain-containing protein [Gallionella sp.]|nr:secretin N-terminal domain-containing protein [Gallionella sp.]